MKARGAREGRGPELGAGRGGWPVGPLTAEARAERKQLFCLMSASLSLDSRQDFKQINTPLGSWNALADNFRP